MSEVKTPPKRLVDLNPHWIKFHGEDRIAGLQFDCPCGDKPVSDGGPCTWGPVYIPVAGDHAWGCSPAPSETANVFDTLTLTPSVHAPGHWHGFVTNGQVTSC